jgi:hypothetical protein
LIHEIDKKEEICMCVPWTFKDVELKYPSSHKEITIVKNIFPSLGYYLS